MNGLDHYSPTAEATRFTFAMVDTSAGIWKIPLRAAAGGRMCRLGQSSALSTQAPLSPARDGTCEIKRNKRAGNCKAASAFSFRVGCGWVWRLPR